MGRNASRTLLGEWIGGAEPDALKGARPVLNGGREETCRKVTRLAPTQPSCTRVDTRGTDEMGTDASWASMENDHRC
jgi:hypothetical protein